MKVQPTDPRAPVLGPKAQPFKQLLAPTKKAGPEALRPEALPKASARQPQPRTSAAATAPAAKKPGAPYVLTAAKATAVTTAASARLVQQTHQVGRQRVEAEAERLTQARAQHHEAAGQLQVKGLESTESAQQKVEARILSLIVQELESSFEKEPVQVPRAAFGDIRLQAFNAEPARTAQPSGPPARAEQAVALIERIETFVKSSRPALALTLTNSLGARVEIERLGPGKVALKLVGHRGPPSADAISRIRDELKARGIEVGPFTVA